MPYQDIEGDFANINPEKRKSRKPIGKLFLTLFSILFFLILTTIFISYSFNNKYISQRDLYLGEDFNLDNNDSLLFKFEKQRHKANITVIGSSSIYVTIQSNPITKLIKINESVFFDLNNDTEYDLRVWLIEIVNYKAVVEFKRVDGQYCIPNWECKKWGDCIDGLRRRECFDLNRCGKSNFPDIERFCSDILGSQEEIIQEQETILENNTFSNASTENEESGELKNQSFIGDGELSCTENNGKVCTSDQKCQGNWINSSNSLRCCFGNCYFPDVDLISSNTSISCDESLSAFRSAVSNCTFFEMNCFENILIPELGVIHGFESVFEIQGYYPGNNCLFRYAYGDVFLNYTSDKYYEFVEQGMSNVQIEFQLDSLKNQHITKYKNKEIICKYPKYEFLDFARDWEDGEIDWSRDVLGKYDCQGNLSLF